MYKAKVSWEELKETGVLKGLYVNKSIRCVTLQEAFKLASELKEEYTAKNINIERIKNAV